MQEKDKPTAAPRVRSLKVYDKVFHSNRNYRRRPEIRLIGKWLQDCGFCPGQYIEVVTEQNRLTIRHREG